MFSQDRNIVVLMVSDDAKLAGGVLAAAAVIGAGYYFLTQQKKASTAPVSSLSLAESSSQISVGQTDTFTASATDSSGNPVSGAVVTFTEQNTGSVLGTSTTNASGAATLKPSFNTAGSFTIIASA